MRLKVLPAFNGDSLILEWNKSNKDQRLLIDGGIPATYPKYLKKVFEKFISDEYKIDLMIITHIDDDHIGGIIKLFEDSELDKSLIRRVWFNSGCLISKYFNTENKNREVALTPNNNKEMSVKQGITLESFLSELNVWEKTIIRSGFQYDLNGLHISVLSPNDNNLSVLNEKWEIEREKITKMSSQKNDYKEAISSLIKRPFIEDRSVPNGSSIALLVKNESKSALLLGDSHPSTIVSSLKQQGFSINNKLKVDAVKVSHHASKGNTSDELLDLIECSQFIICTDGSKHGLPDKEALARIINKCENSKLYFNYRNNITQNIFSKEDRDNFKFECLFLEDLNYTMEL